MRIPAIVVLLCAQISRYACMQIDLCPELFMRYSAVHTFCLPDNSSCNILRKSVSYDEKAFIVAEHNELRSKVATNQESIGPLPPAANMMQMVWDDDLAEIAQKHANQCKMEHDCNNCRKIKNFNVGQNLYEYEIASLFPPRPNWTAAIHAWYNEVQDFDLGMLTYYVERETPKPYGHFTQLVWGDTWRIGCGYTLHIVGKTYHEQYTCNYGPSGNIKEQALYEEGVHCSQCPANSCCDESCSTSTADYPGLCKLLYDEEPYFEDPKAYILRCDFRDDVDCPIETPVGMKKWETSQSLSGSYIGVILDGGETTILKFLTPLKAATTMCVSLFYRKGPNIAGHEVANSAYESFIITPTGQNVKAPLNENSNVFSKFSMTLNWNQETQFSISFSVPPQKPAQFLEIKGVLASEGSC